MHLPIALLSGLALAMLVTAATGAEAPRGAYVSLTARDAAACSQACAADGICMAWSFARDNQCQLRAIVPGAPAADVLASGYAARAPAFLQPLLRAAGDEQTAAVLAPGAPEPRQAGPSLGEDGALLGGPAEGDLRLGLR